MMSNAAVFAAVYAAKEVAVAATLAAAVHGARVAADAVLAGGVLLRRVDDAGFLYCVFFG